MRGISSAGRAPALHAGGQEFESPILHHLKKRPLKVSFLLSLLCFSRFEKFVILYFNKIVSIEVIAWT